MNKPLLVISCPIDCYSGYSERSRDIVKSLLAIGKYNVRILSQRWGNTPFGYLKEDNPEHKSILDCIINNPNEINIQPDIWIQVTIPNEFQAVGKYNIGITAGIETTICDPSWIEGCNRMNLVLTSSEHSKNVFLNTKAEKREQNTNRILEIVELKTKVEVLFEGFDPNIFKKLDTLPKTEFKFNIDSIPENFCYLSVGHWMHGTLGNDRKDMGMLVQTFLDTFKDKKHKPALILKTNAVGFSILDREEILSKIDSIRKQFTSKNLPNIYVLHGELDSNEMNELYNHNKVKALISFTKGEGFGRPLLEFTVTQKPVIVSNWSGHLDFLKFFVKLEGKLNLLDNSSVVQNMLIPESSWFTVDYKEASNIMNKVFQDYSIYIEGAKRQSYLSKTEFSLDKMKEKLENILDSNIPKNVPIILPKLDINNLPKLKKV